MEQNRLKFKHEMKGSFIKHYSQYLTTNSWNDFEFLLSQHFFHYLGSQLLVVDSPYLAWLSKKIRSLQSKTSSTLTFRTDYVHSSIKVKEQKRIIQFLKFLIYVRDLDYDSEFLGDTRYRCVTFKLNHFLEFLHGPNYRSEYPLKKLRDFCDDIKKDFFVRSVSDRHFQSLIAVPQVDVYKEKDWIGKFWIVDDLFYSNYPSSFAIMFDFNLSKSEFFVLFEIFKMLETEL